MAKSPAHTTRGGQEAMSSMRVGLIGYGKAGQAVARVFAADEVHQLAWVARRQSAPLEPVLGGVPVCALSQVALGEWLDAHPVDALVDFSSADAVYQYGPLLAQRQMALVTAISDYSAAHIAYLQQLGQRTRVLCSPNITLGINFLLMAAKLLRGIAPFADVQVVEQHFREKPEVSGTARKIAASLDLDDERVTSLRLGGIVGHHEVIFGFPHQTVRLIHDSIRREAFGTGALYALRELAQCPPGCYSFDDLLHASIRRQMLSDSLA